MSLNFIRSLLMPISLALAHGRGPVIQRALSPYAPVTTSCPSSSLVRAADGISTAESSYIQQRQSNANQALAAWLQKTNPSFPTDNLPIIGLTTSGGGYRSLLTGAGVIQSLDARDSNTSVSGLYQALTYQAGLSGGAWLLSSFSGNNWPTITSLKTGLWETTFEDSLADPSGLLVVAADVAIVADIADKSANGFDPTMTDPYGRLL
jgi:lysophospholipase